MRQRPYESSNKWQKLKPLSRFWKSSIRKAKRNYQRTLFKLRMEIAQQQKVYEYSELTCKLISQSSVYHSLLVDNRPSNDLPDE